MDTERRQGHRIEVNWPIMLTSGESICEGETLNLSVEGISFCSDDPIDLKKNYNISIRPPGRPSVEVTGKVSWSDLYGMDDKNKMFCIGICFLEIAEGDCHFIEDMIEDQLK